MSNTSAYEAAEDYPSAHEMIDLAFAYSKDIAAFFHDDCNLSREQIIAAYKQEEMTEGYASHLLKIDRVQLRLLAEEYD